jgi:response regulator RpfG family c-di-GMP phosphodiesterase
MERNSMKRSILYLDDEPACLKLFTDVIGADYDVRTTSDHAEAGRLLAEHGSDIVISDQHMPGVQGTRFLREVADRYPGSCRVLLSGAVTAGEVLTELGRGGIHIFLAKPWTEQGMRQMLERAGFVLSRNDPEAV